MREAEARAIEIKTLVEGLASPFWAWQVAQWRAAREKYRDDLESTPADNVKRLAHLQGCIAELKAAQKAPSDRLDTLRKGD